jgi:glycosyltransferase involved in cell wall biosynthesis
MNILWLAPVALIDNKNVQPATWVMTLAKALAINNVNLTIVNYNSKIKKDVVEIEYENIKIIYIKTPKLKLDFITFYQLRIYKVKKYLKKIANDFDVLHIHGTEHQYEAMSIGLKIPKVISIQGIMHKYVRFIPASRYKQFLEWRLSAFYETKYIKKNYYYSCRTNWDSSIIRSNNPQAKIYMIWEMIREEFFYDHFSSKKENILFVGGKNPVKGLKELLCAYDNSLQSHGLKLIVLGVCSIKDVQSIVNEEGLKSINIKNIDCRGMQDARGMIKAYEESYCLVHPTYIDNSPNSVCEAQLAGLPVIATDVGGVSSLIENLQTGLLIENKPKAIEIAVKKLYDDDLLREYISKESRWVARERHNPKIILSKTLSMYKELINEKKK